MKKFAATAFVALSLLALGGCVMAPTSNLPAVDVSKMANNKVLTPAEIDAVVRGKQMIGNIARTSGYTTRDVLYVFEANGTIKGSSPDDWDSGKWYVDHSLNMLCYTWNRWTSGCGKVSVRNGKFHRISPVTGAEYLQH